MNHEVGSVLIAPSTGSSREDERRRDGFVSRAKGSILSSPPRGPWRVGGLGVDGLLSCGEGSILLSTPRCSELRGSGRGCFGGSEKGVAFSGFLAGFWAGHKLSVVLDDSLRNSGWIGLGDEGPGVVGGCREGSGQGHTVRVFSEFSKRLSSRRGHCSPRSDLEGGVSGLEELRGEILGLSGDGSSGKGPVGGGVAAGN